MNPAVITGIVGGLTLAFGAVGLIRPSLVMSFAGLMPSPDAIPAAVMGEIRAVYGGQLIVIGAFTLQAALAPAAHRARLTFIGLLWLGVCAGRLFGVTVEGSPGLMGWLNAALEFLAGTLLLLASRARAVEPVGMGSAPVG